jgi:hypothetical protein
MSPYFISGELRRKKKKELASLKSFVKSFWRYEDIDRVYGGGLDDNTCHKILSDAEKEIKELELELSKPSLDIIRDNKINRIFEV